MKLLLLIVLMALTSIVCGSASSLDNAESLFKVFMSKFGKEYKEKEKSRRFEIFKENLKRVSAMNEADPHAKFSPLTRWADMTEEEYTTMHGMHGPLGNQTPCQWPEGGSVPFLKPTVEPKKNLDYVSSFRIEKFNNKKIIYKVIFNNNPEIFIEKMLTLNFKIDTSSDIWKIR